MDKIDYDFYWQIVINWAQDMPRVMKKLSVHEMNTLTERLVSITNNAILGVEKVKPTAADSMFIDAVRSADKSGSGEFKLSDIQATELLAKYRMSILREAFPQGEESGEWDQLTKKEMWDTIQEIRQRLGSDGTCSIISDIDALEERAKESSTDRCAKCGYTVYGCHCNPAEACAALHKHEEAEKALREALKAINIEHKQDGTWLMIDSGGLHAAINIGYRELGRDGYDGIIGRAIDNWRLNRVALLANETEVK